MWYCQVSFMIHFNLSQKIQTSEVYLGGSLEHFYMKIVKSLLPKYKSLTIKLVLRTSVHHQFSRNIQTILKPVRPKRECWTTPIRKFDINLWLLLVFVHIQKIKCIIQPICEIFNFQKSCNLIGWEHCDNKFLTKIYELQGLCR